MASGTIPIPTGTGADIEGLTLREPRRLERLIGPESARIVYGLFSNRLSIAGMIIVAAFVLTALLAPVLAPPLKNRDPFQIPRDGFGPEPKPPGTEWRTSPPPIPFWYQALTGRDKWIHILGTTSGQYDIWYGVIWGSATALKVGIIIVGIALAIGIVVGSVAAYYGGWVDDVLMRITEIFMAFPFLLAALTLASILVPKFGRSIVPAIIALIAFGWMTYARIVRGDILTVKERDYVTAARVIGAKDSRILMRHILPNAIFATLVLASLDIGSIVLSFAALSFLGVGTDIGYADWGQLVSFARNWILTLDKQWWIIVYPGLTLIFFGLGWNLVGDALRDILDPKLRGARG
jgi:peptide/nickel transport system permease protein